VKIKKEYKCRREMDNHSLPTAIIQPDLFLLNQFSTKIALGFNILLLILVG
jgi:hypothetical protein